MNIIVQVGGDRLAAWSLAVEAEPDSYILRMRDGSTAPIDCHGWEVEGPGIPSDTVVVDVAPDGSSIIMLNPWEAPEAIVPARAKAWVGNEDLRPVGLALRDLVARKRLLGELPDDATLTVVMTIRPDNHGRVVAFPLDLLAAEEDRWKDDVLTSAPITQVRWTPPESSS